jgi:signal transduction histidine kinase
MIGALSWLVAGRALVPAQAAWVRQQGFVAGASHELRTPLTLMRASAEVALRVTPAGDADRRELLGDVLHEIDHMSHLVEDLLMLTRLDAGRLPLERTAVALPEAIADVGRQFGRLAADKGLTLRCEVPEATVMADPTRLRQVLLILFDNATRYTPAGGVITITARPEPRHMLRLAVSDTGSGITPEHLPHIFERFYRADAARGVAGNAGLGLSIASGLVEAMGGRIAAVSPASQGATIWFTLPLAP